MSSPHDSHAPSGKSPEQEHPGVEDDEPPFNEPTLSNRTLSLLGGIGVILIFVLILAIAYVPNNPGPSSSEQQDQERLATLQEVKTEQEGSFSTYEVVNADEGIYKIPVEEAKRLVVRERARAESENQGG